MLNQKRALDTMIVKMMEDRKLIMCKKLQFIILIVRMKRSLYERIRIVNVNVFISSIGPVIGLHVGPGAIELCIIQPKGTRYEFKNR